MTGPRGEWPAATAAASELASTAVPERPLLVPWARAAVEHGRVAVQRHDTAVILEGAAAEALVPSLLGLLGGERTVAELADCFGEAVAPAVVNALGVLAERALLVEGPSVAAAPPATARQAELCAAHGLAGGRPASALASLAARRVTVVGSGACAALAAALVAGGGPACSRVAWDEATEDDDVDLLLAVPAPHERAGLVTLNTALLASGRTWLPVPGLDGARAIVGPIVVPGASCCFECFRRRRAAATGFGDAWAGLDAAVAPDLPGPATALVAAIAAQVALCALVDGIGVAVPAGVAWAIDLAPDVTVSPHVVHRLPRCPACSTAAALPPLLPWRAGVQE